MRVSGIRLALAVMVLGLLAGCGDQKEGPRKPERVPLGQLIADEDPVTREQRCLNLASTPGCFGEKVLHHYCAVLRIRDFYRAGRFKVSDLAPWMDPTMRSDGAPQIYDFRSDPRGPLSWDDLDAFHRWARRHGMPMPIKLNYRCANRVSQIDVERTEGGPKMFDEDSMMLPDFLEFRMPGRPYGPDGPDVLEPTPNSEELLTESP